MMYILAGVLLLESILFMIKTLLIKNKYKIFIWGIVGALFMIIMEYIGQTFLSGIGFAISHVFLLFLYLYYNYEVQIQKIKSKELKLVLQNYVEIPTSFYLIPFILLVSVFFNVHSKVFACVNILLLFVCVIISVYNFKENKTLQILYEKGKEEKEIKRYIEEKNVLVELFCIMLAVSVGITYIHIFNLLNTKYITVCVLAELFFVLMVYTFCCGKFKMKLYGKERRKMFQQKIIVPKTVGVGYTFNMDNPLSYIVIILIVIIIVIGLGGLS